MKKGKFGLALFSALVLLAVLGMALHRVPEPVSGPPVAIRAGEETLNVWTEDGETYVAFLPGHVAFEEVAVKPVQEGAMVDGRALPLSGTALEPDRSYELTWQENGEDRRGTLRLLPSAGMPALFLDTQSGSMDHIHDQKGNAERGTLRLYDETGCLNFSGSFASLRGRGNSTWEVPEKKPYALDLSDEADLLGMGIGKNWILLADAMDASGLRNRIAYEFAAQLGMTFVPQLRWTEVYLNGDYAGLYLLCQRIENESGRLDLGRDGVVLRMDRDTRIKEETDPYFFTAADQCLQILDGRDSTALRENFQAMEDALLADSDSWQDRIDLNSWVNQYLMEEVFTSYDAGFQSQYFFCYEPDGKIHAGPVWDYDASMGNPDLWALQSPRGLFAWRPEAIEGYATPWYHSLYEKPEFRQALVQQYRQVFLPRLEILLNETIEDYVNQITPAWERNRIRWDVQTQGLEAETAHITGYLKQRMDFLSDLWLEEKQMCVVRLRDDGGFYIHYALEPGSALADLPHMADDRFPQWYRQDTGEIWNLSAPVWEDLDLDSVPPEPKTEEHKEEGLRDLILRVYHYVPVAVLLLMGLVLVPVGLWKSRSRQGQKEKTKV